MARGPWWIVGGVVAAAIVGYAMWTAPGPSTPAKEPASGPVERDDAAGRTGNSPGPVRGGIKPAPASAKGDARPRGTPPRKVEPTVSLERARRDYGDVIAEIEAVAAEGRRLTQPEYVDLYKRGNDAILPLQQHLDWSVPEQAEELGKLQTDFRSKLAEVEPGPIPQ